MKIERTTSGDQEILAISGDFDTSNAAKFDAELEILIGEYRTELIIDLTHVTFLDSQGVTRLISAQRRLRPLGGQLVIAGAHNFVKSTLKTVGFDALAPMFPDRAEAHTHFTDPDRARPLDLEGVPVDEALLGRIDVALGRPNAPERTATGKLLATYDDGLMIRCSEAESQTNFDCEFLDVGTRLALRFHQPMIARGREFSLEAEVVYAYDEGDHPRYRLRFTKIDESDATLMRDFSRAQDDMRKYGKPLEGV